jgi:hypothetical protein
MFWGRIKHSGWKVKYGICIMICQKYNVQIGLVLLENTVSQQNKEGNKNPAMVLEPAIYLCDNV